MTERARSLRRRRNVGRWLLVVFLVLGAIGSTVAARLGLVDRARDRLYGRAPRLSPGDFPAGVMAPIDDVVRIPTRALVIGVVPRGPAAALLWAAGDAERIGLFRAAYAIDVKVQRFEREEELRKALVRGGDNGGVDLAALPVSSLAMSASLLREAAPRVVMLVGRSRGGEVVAGKGVSTLQQLQGKRIGVEDRGASWYLLLWSLSRVGLSLRDVQLVPLDDAYSAGAALARKDVDAVAGLLGDVEPALQPSGAQVLTSTADAPHLLATVLVARGDFAARYPDAIRRVIRGVLDANGQVLKDRSEAARVLGTVAPQLGDPMQAIAASPPATLKENLAFFGIADEAPVTYAELFKSAAELNQKLFSAPRAPEPEDTADLGALKYVATPQPRELPVKTRSTLIAALSMPANFFALSAGGLASVLLGDPTPVLAAGGASLAYSVTLSMLPSFRRAVRANLEAQVSSDVASPEEREALLADLAPSQREHYDLLRELKDRILESYGKMPGGRVLVASSERRLEALLTSFLRLVATLNSYRKYLNATDRKAIEEELASLQAEVVDEKNERLREVKTRRAEILKKRVARFVQAEESREVVSHQLASIEDILRLTHEQSIAIRDPEVVSRQLEALTAEVNATEETVKEMEQFMQITEELGGPSSVAAPSERVR